MRKIKISREKMIEILFLISVFILYFIWAVVIPFGRCPDEEFRYKIPDYIYQFGRLPHGGDSYIMDETWGISYGFTPILSYIISGILMKITGIFTDSAEALHMAARTASVLFSTGTAFFAVRIGKRLFKGAYSWLFILFVTLLPQFVFVSAYVNCDAICIFSVSWIIYGMIYGNDRNWDLKSSIFLGAGIGVCLLSYYNAYGAILMAAVFCIASVIFNKEIKNKLRFIMIRIMWVALAAFVVAGWWFIRSYIIYDGDLLGLSASREYAEKYAAEAFKPENRQTPDNMGYSLEYMLFEMKWIKTSIESFIGRFGLFDVQLPSLYHKFIGGLIVVGVLGNFSYRKARKSYEVKQKAIFNFTMAAICLITVGISVYYSYFNDFQPQGRYCLPMIVPLGILVTAGIGGIVNILPKKTRPYVIAVICILYMWIALAATFNVIIPAYYYV